MGTTATCTPSALGCPTQGPTCHRFWLPHPQAFPKVGSGVSGGRAVLTLWGRHKHPYWAGLGL